MDKHVHADQLAQSGGLQSNSKIIDGFVLRTYSRINHLDEPINVYIEGDGLAWISRHELSSDPTPREAVGLALAAQDPASNVVYLARPCQFNDFNQMPCDSTYWSDKRFSEKVIAAMDEALMAFSKKTHGQKINLIGYSGGAAVAVLLAARRNDIASLRTVAGNLDHVYVNQYHQVNAMPESLNAIDAAEKIRGIPQLHFVGTQDKVIPQSVVLRFIEQQNTVRQEIAQQKPVNCSVLIKVNAAHQKGWVAQWQRLLRQPFPC
ncbi:MAG: alpha/beta hydrolase [Methylotenera sp.]|uniref:alpha/beta hydrolase n=1 Tax=Methylotenera sp. TaxID=2051956 RepID=UPI002722F979|nr:alpha/beta hydrolase [Methylotenera sp.]MDO9394851.1 alpha/beta hydrolase [Methylotenera sp.]MDP1522735.1 alpha/beta hydrolase [Methylotenera sp.]MDP3330407.1 hypothetical protein [Methylococcaceae bacterium]